MSGIEFVSRVRDIPVYPAAETYAFDGELVKLASNETPFSPHPQVLEAVLEVAGRGGDSGPVEPHP